MKTQVATVALVVFLQVTLVDGSVLKWFQDSKNPQQTLTECITTATVDGIPCADALSAFNNMVDGEMSFFMVPDRLFDAEFLDGVCGVEGILQRCISQCSIGVDRAPTTKEFMATSIYKTTCTEDNIDAFKQATVCLKKAADAGGGAECQTNDRCGSFNTMMDGIGDFKPTSKEQYKAKIHTDICNFASCLSRCQKGVLERSCTAQEAAAAARIITTDGIVAYFDMFKQQIPAEIASTFPANCYTRTARAKLFKKRHIKQIKQMTEEDDGFYAF